MILKMVEQISKSVNRWNTLNSNQREATDSVWWVPLFQDTPMFNDPSFRFLDNAVHDGLLRALASGKLDVPTNGPATSLRTKQRHGLQKKTAANEIPDTT